LDIKQIEKEQDNDAYSLYVYAIRYPVTRDVYLRRLRIFFNHIQLLSMDEPMDVRCNIFAQKTASNIGEYIHLVLFRDIIRNRRINNPIALEDLLRIIAKESSQIISRETLENTLNLKREGLNSYIYLLKSTFLISESEFFSTNRTKSIRREKKIQIHDIGIRNALSSEFNEKIIENDTEMGKVVETVVTDHIRRLKFNLEPIPEPRTFYWKEKNEVDIIINPFNKIISTEVKYRENINANEIKGLEQFIEKYNPSISLVITKKDLKINNTIIFIPLWIFLLLC
jgi:predicted AAA+ superfamily ATPase